MRWWWVDPMGGRMHVRWDETGVRGDAVAAQALGLRGLVSEDSVRRALKASEPEASEPWMRDALPGSVQDALDPALGAGRGRHDQATVWSPGGCRDRLQPAQARAPPSHVLHTFWVGNLRLVLDAHLSAGKQHTAGHGKAALARLLDELGERGPALVRGDCGYGNEDIIDVCEQRARSRWSTTGGAGTCARPTRRRDVRR